MFFCDEDPLKFQNNISQVRFSTTFKITDWITVQ